MPDFVKVGPTVWHGLPDLRDMSNDLDTWYNIPITVKHASILCETTVDEIYRMIKNDRVTARNMFGVRFVELGSLTQTPRCAYIEHILAPDKVEHSDNVLIRNKILCAGASISRVKLKSLIKRGEVQREYLPNGIARYPKWGIKDPDMREAVIAYHDEFVMQRKRA